MGDAGIFAADAGVELIEGEVIDMAPIGSRHAGTVRSVASPDFSIWSEGMRIMPKPDRAG